MRRGLWPSALALAVTVVVSCGKDDLPGTPAPIDGGSSSGAGGAGGAAPTSDAGLVPCLDRPTELERPPSGQLPCELLPPDFGR
jgi:hypothetical protein